MSRVLRVPVENLALGERPLPEPEARYVTRVHRLREGDRFAAFDPENGTEAEAEIVRVGRSETVCRFGAPTASTRVPRADVTLYQALGKGDKPEQVIRTATALGARAVVFVQTARVVARGDPDTRRRRLVKIAVDSARQCGRGDVPRIEGPLSFQEAIERARSDSGLRILLDVSTSEPLGTLLARWRRGQPLSLMIGPEGGFDEAERAAALQAGFSPASLGSFVLRTETAAIASLGAIAALGAE